MIEISFQYQPFIKLSVNHNYYSDQPAMDFNLVPTNNCRGLIKSLGFIFKKTERNYVLLFQPENSEKLIKWLKSGNQINLSFELYCSNPYFLNYTDIKSPDVSKVYYFSNINSRRSGEDLILHQKEFADESDHIRLIEQVELSAVDSPKNFEIKDEKSFSVFQQKLDKGEKVLLNNRQLPLGKYFLYEGGKLKDKFVLNSELQPKKPIAVFNISLTDQKDFITNLEHGNIPVYSYKTNFNTRSTLWKYYFLSKYADNLKGTRISSPNSKKEFKGPKEVVLSNGKEAVEFVSKEPIQLKERFEYRFQLRSTNGNEKGKALVESLPLASCHIIKPESANGNSNFFSEIIVYI